MRSMILRLCQRAAYGALFSLALAPTAMASGPGPGGVNVGFNFNWTPTTSPPGATGYTAAFINATSSSGASLNTCIGVCNFAITYSVGGTPQPSVLPDGNYETWTPPGRSGGVICDNGAGNVPNNTSPLTLFNCFNANSFGQIITPTTTGMLSGMTMPMTCLNPAGGTLTGLVAVLYQVSGNSIPATPLAQVPVDLSTCPTLTSWDGHTFSSADFANIPLNFSGVTLTSGTTYGVFFAGLVPGSQPPGALPAVSAVSPTTGLTTGGTTVTITGTAFTGATSVKFGSSNATTFTVNSDTQITATSPAGAAGTVDVTVTTSVGTSATSAADQFTYTKANTTTTVTSSTNPSVFGQSATFTATVAPVAATGTPTGTVTFLDGGSPIGTGTLSGGTATFTTSALAVGNHTITTSYTGDGNFNSSNGSLTGNPQVVNKTASSVALQSSLNPSMYGQSVTFTATVSGQTPTGSVTFTSGALTLCAAVALSGNTVTCATTALPVGSDSIIAAYSGDARNNTSQSSAFTQTVNRKTTTVSLVVAPNPIVLGQSVTITATVAGDPPTGSVSFTDNGNTLPCSPVTLVPGTTSSTAVCTATLAGSGSHSIVATYSGDGNFAGSVSSAAVVAVNMPPVAAPVLDRWAMLLLTTLISVGMMWRLRRA